MDASLRKTKQEFANAAQRQARDRTATASVRDTSRWSTAGTIAFLLAIAFAFRVAIAWVLPTLHHPDEVFQYLEQGYRLVFGYGVIPWEYREGVRSWLLPGFIGGIIAAVDGLGGGPAVWRTMVTMVFAAASLSVVATSYFWARQLAGTGAAIVSGLVAAVWFEIVYFAPKPLTEIVATSAFFPAAYLLCGVRDPSVAKRISGGILLGLTFALRFQLAPAIGIVAIASMIATPWPRWLVQAAAAAAVVVGAGLLDWITWDYPFQSIWLNFIINFVQDKAAAYGTDPVYWYPLLMINSWSGFTVPMLFLIFWGARRAPPLLSVIPVAILISHSLIGHKEYRFIYPMLPFVLLLASIGSAHLLSKTTANWPGGRRNAAFMLVCAAWIGTSAATAATGGAKKWFTERVENIQAFELARSVDGGCGIALIGVGWWKTPGYSGLHKDIPIYIADDEETAIDLRDAYDIAVHARNGPELPTDYRPLACYRDTCVSARVGECVPKPEFRINKVLERIGA